MAGVRTPAPAETAQPAAIEVLRGYLAAQSTAFLAQLPRLRQGHPEAAHRIRVASRRARSMLRTFKPLLDEEWADELSGRLVQFTTAVGPERDVEVVRRRLLAGFDMLGDQDAGVARARNLVDRLLQREATLARESTLAILAGPGFHALADQIALAPAALPGLPAAREPAEQALYPLVRESFAAIERKVRRLPQNGTGTPGESDGGGRGGPGGAGAAGTGAGLGENGGESGGGAAEGAKAAEGAGAGEAKPGGARAGGPKAGGAKSGGTKAASAVKGRKDIPARRSGDQPTVPSGELAEQAADEAWHRLRVSAKRGRYAAEVCVPLAGAGATGLAEQLTRLTEALGQQQDAAMASAVLTRAAQTPRIVAPTAFALGRLLGAQRAEIARARWAFPAVWAQVCDEEHRRWLDC